MSDRDLILGRIRRGLEQSGPMLRREADAFPPPQPHGPFVASDLAPIDQFAEELEKLQGHIHRCATAADALAKLRDLLVAHDATSALHWDPAELPIPGVEQTLRELGIASAEGMLVGAADRQARVQALDEVPICISGADAAIAESGSIVVVSGPGRGRAASLLAPVHIAILPADRIARTLPDAFDLLYARFGRDLIQRRSNVTIISGPSRSADIEQTLTLGVHGPKEVHVVVVEQS
jgi:L-lactate dehydrogenase complex protein LldG